MFTNLLVLGAGKLPNGANAHVRRGAWAGMLVLAVAFTALQPRTAMAIAGGRLPDLPFGASGMTSACMYQEWDNGTGVPLIQPQIGQVTPTPVGIVGLGAPTNSGTLLAFPFVSIVNGNTTWSVPHGATTDNTCVQWDAYFLASADGTYTFTTRSDDGSMLWIGTTTVVFNNYSQGATPRSGNIILNRGYHLITMTWGNGTGGYDMTASSQFTDPVTMIAAPVRNIDLDLQLRLLPTPTFSPTFPTNPPNQTNLSNLTVFIKIPGNAPNTGTPPGGPPTAQQTVYYTTDGSVPTIASNVYTAAGIAIAVPKTINAIVTQAGFNTSQVGTITYTNPPAGIPTFSSSGLPAPGLPGPYAFPAGGLTVTITSPTANAFIYYTLDGSLPTFQNYNTVGASPVTLTLNGTTTINAFASSLGFAPSTTVTGTYTRTNVVPSIVSCLASGVPTQVNVVFKANVSSATANNVANYQIDNGVTVTAAVLDADKKTVRLTVTPLSAGIPYNLTVTNINDSGNTSTLVSATTPFQYFNGGGLLYERYENVPGSLVSDLTGQPPIKFFPDFPASFTIDPAPGMVLPTFEEPQNTSFLSYGSRMSGYFIAPATGSYNFAVTADDTALLSLSSDDNPNNKGFLTAKVTKTSNPRQWNYDQPPGGADENKFTFNLTMGKRYYIETLHKQDFSLDNLAVSYVFPPATFVDTPGFETLPTDAYFNGNVQLTPAIDALRIVQQPTPQQFATPNQQVTLVFDVSGSAPRTVQWSLDQGSGAVDIPGADFGVYIIPNMSAADAGTYYCRMTNTITTTPLVSNGAIVTMLDTTPISVSSISPNSGTLAGVTNFPAVGGMQTVVNGQHFIPGMLVVINGTTAQVVSSTATTITVTVPPSAVIGAVNVQVTKPGGGPVTLVGGFIYDDLPVATAQVLTTNEDTAIPLGSTLSATDQSNMIAAFTIVQQPTKGVVTIASSTLSNKSSNGTVVTMTTSAPHSFAVGNTVSVKCNPPDAKIDLANAVITSITASTFSYNKTAVAVGSTPTAGTAQLITNTAGGPPFTGTIPFTYTPFANQNNNTAPVGPDTFTFTANDGFLDSAPVTVTINITPVNDAPTITNPGNQTVTEDVPVTLILNNVFVSPATATDERTGGATPQTFTSLTVTSNNAPLFLSQDGLNTNTLTLTQTPAQFAVGTASLKFTPAFPGSATLTITLVDSGSNVAPNVSTTVITFNVTVTSVNDAPVINNPGPQVGTGDVSSTVPLTGIAAAPPNNPDEYPAQNPGLTLSVSSSDPTYFTSLTVSAIAFAGNIGSATLSYVPAFARNGPVTITVTVDDHQAVNNTTSIQFVLNLTRVNHKPTAVNDFYSPTVNKVFTVPAPGVLGNDTDPDTNPVDVLSVAAVPAHTSPVNGVLVLNADGSFTYTPNPGFIGLDTFTYFVNDGTVNSATSATVTFNVGANLPPVAMDQVIPGVEDTVLNATLNGSDPNFDTLTFKIVTPPAVGTGTVVLTNATTGTFSYTPPLNFNGPVTFTYSVNDGQFDSNIATVTINVAPVNDAPVATPQSVFAGQNKTLDIILTATDVENDPLTFSITVPPTQGILSSITQLTPNSAKVTYTPNVNYIGADSFQFTAKDASLTSAPATVSITVTPPPVFSSTPTISPNPALTGSPVTGSASAIVSNGAATITWNFGDGGTATGTDVTYIYTQSGVFTITVTATSPEGLSTTYTLVIQVGIGLVTPLPPGAIPPGTFGILVGGTGITAGDKAALSVNYVSRDRTAFSGSVSGLSYPANLNQGQLVNQVGMLTFGQGALAQQFVFTLNATGKGKATGLPLVQVGLKKGTFSFKESGRKEMTDLIIALGAGNVVQGNGHQILNIPVSLQIGNSLFLAMTFQMDYVQSATTGKGKLVIPTGKKR